MSPDTVSLSQTEGAAGDQTLLLGTSSNAYCAPSEPTLVTNLGNARAQVEVTRPCPKAPPVVQKSAQSSLELLAREHDQGPTTRPARDLVYGRAGRTVRTQRREDHERHPPRTLADSIGMLQRLRALNGQPQLSTAMVARLGDPDTAIAHHVSPTTPWTNCLACRHVPP
jgi:hypothetical protein